MLRDDIDQAFVLAGEADAPDRSRHHLDPARSNGVEHEHAVRITKKQARAKGGGGLNTATAGECVLFPRYSGSYRAVLECLLLPERALKGGKTFFDMANELVEIGLFDPKEAEE